MVALIARWLLVFEDPMSETLWFGKAIPRSWFEDGKTISVSDATTRWGRVGFSTASHLNQNQVRAGIDLPPGRFGARINVRLRTPRHRRLKSVTVNGEHWSDFNAEEEIVTIPSGRSGTLRITAEYEGQ